jgi:hypothetical protein
MKVKVARTGRVVSLSRPQQVRQQPQQRTTRLPALVPYGHALHVLKTHQSRMVARQQDLELLAHPKALMLPVACCVCALLLLLLLDVCPEQGHGAGRLCRRRHRPHQYGPCAC